MICETLRQRWIGDFWEHAAVVRALASHPLAPRHPQLAVDAPHAFFSPHALALGLAARATGLAPTTVLGVAGMLHLALLVFALRRFVRWRFDSPHADFYALLFTLVLWGYPPWFFSGFLHLKSLGHYLGIPSTFATGLMLLTWSLALEAARSPSRRLRLFLLALLWLLILTHPPTALCAGLGLAAFAAEGPPGQARRNLAWAMGIGAGAFLLALAWPYYSLLGVIREGAAFHESNQSMYDNVLRNTAPALLGAPLLFLRLKARRLDGLVLLFLGLLAVYLYGALSGAWTWGRVLPVMVMVLHLVLADFASRAEEAVRQRGWKSPLEHRAGLAALVALVVVCGSRFAPEIIQPFQRTPGYLAEYEPLTRHIGEDDVVVADLVTSWYLPAYCGKVVATLHPLAFVPDWRRRVEDLDRFFQPRAGERFRREVIARYGARFLLVDREEVPLSAAAERELRNLGEVIYEKHPLVLIKLQASP